LQNLGNEGGASEEPESEHEKEALAMAKLRLESKRNSMMGSTHAGEQFRKTGLS
jgi:hypothetical protein